MTLGREHLKKLKGSVVKATYRKEQGFGLPEVEGYSYGLVTELGDVVILDGNYVKILKLNDYGISWTARSLSIMTI